MASKAVVICAFAFLIQSIAGKVCRQSYTPSSCVSIAVSDNGGPLAVTSIGPITPTGIALATDVGLAGNLDIAGTLPYLSAVAFDGQFATNSVTPLSYSCGDCVAINQELASGNPVSIASISGCGCRN